MKANLKQERRKKYKNEFMNTAYPTYPLTQREGETWIETILRYLDACMNTPEMNVRIFCLSEWNWKDEGKCEEKLIQRDSFTIKQIRKKIESRDDLGDCNALMVKGAYKGKRYSLFSDRDAMMYRILGSLNATMREQAKEDIENALQSRLTEDIYTTEEIEKEASDATTCTKYVWRSDVSPMRYGF